MPRSASAYRPPSSSPASPRPPRPSASAATAPCLSPATSTPTRSPASASCKRRLHAAFDQPEALLGQEQRSGRRSRPTPEIDALLIAAGGSGLIYTHGSPAGSKSSRSNQAAPTYRALQAGRPVDAETGGVAADARPEACRRADVPAIGASSGKHPGDRRRDPGGTTRSGYAAGRQDPAAPRGLAALLSGKYVPAPGEQVSVVLCGANTTCVSSIDQPHTPAPLPSFAEADTSGQQKKQQPPMRRQTGGRIPVAEIVDSSGIM